MNEEICCPKFDPAPWDDRVVTWEEKRFIRDRVFTVFYVPIGFGRAMKRLDGQVRKAGGKILDGLILSDHTSKWNMDLYLAVDREIPGARNVTLSGEFFSRVYEGPYKDTGKWCGAFAQQAESRKLNVDKLYMWYTTCPKCAKKYGRNYVVIMARLRQGGAAEGG
jgi:hypothetical protein